METTPIQALPTSFERTWRSSASILTLAALGADEGRRAGSAAEPSGPWEEENVRARGVIILPFLSEKQLAWRTVRTRKRGFRMGFPQAGNALAVAVIGVQGRPA